MANVVALTQTGTAALEKEFDDLLNARERMPRLIKALEEQRATAAQDFISTFAADLAAVKGEPDKSFVDTQFGRLTTSNNAVADLSKRIDAFTAIAAGIAQRIEDLETANPDVAEGLLTRKIDNLEDKLKKEQDDEKLLNDQIKVLNEELHKVQGLSTTASTPAAKKTKK
jgi:chromosome segregation ATPase